MMGKKKAASIDKRASVSKGASHDKKSPKDPLSKRMKLSDRSKSHSSAAKYIPEQKKPSELRKRAEEALGRYQLLAESSRDIILFIRHSDGRILEANRAAVETYGYKHNELLGMNICALRFPEDQSIVAEQMRQADNNAIRFETRHVCSDGSVIAVEVNSYGTTLKGERILLSIIRDITDHKKSEDALQKSEERFRALIEHSHDAITLLAADGTVLYDSPSIQRVLGYSPTERIGRSVFEFVHPEDRRNMTRGFANFVQQPGAVDPSEVRFLHKDGTLRQIEGVRTNLLHESAVQAVVVNYRDITERKRAEEALKISEEKYRLVVENANDAILVLQDGMIKFPNHQATALSGYSEEEITGVPFASFIHADDKDMAMEMHRKRLQGDKIPLTYSFRFINKSGEAVWVQVTGVFITWEGRPAALVFLKDITIQKKLEEQLLQSQKMEAIGTLAGGVAHDFNNLLMGILGYTSLMLMKTGKTHLFYEKLKTIERLVESGAELTRQLLGFARGGKYQVKPVNVNEMIIKTSDIFGRTKREITIHRKLPEDVHTIEADTGQMEQVLFNLYVNAWQAMPSGGRLYLETQNVILDEQQFRTYKADPGSYVKITVTDTGIGMDSETQKRIFEPFFSTKGIGKGMGLGMASAYGIIKNHGGIINVYSEKGHGATFTLLLPASEAKPLEPRPLEGSLLTGHETILIVDDEQEVLSAVKELLEELGYRTLTAKSGRKAIELYKKHSKDIKLVILDMIMPEMNGKETLIKLMEIDKNVCVLLSSGYNIDGEAAHILEMGCKGFIQKPFRAEELSLKIRDVLESGDS